MKKRHKIQSRQLLLHIILIIGALIVIFPILWSVLGSFKTEGEIVGFPPTFFPQTPTIENYITVFTQIDFAIYFRNSIILSIIIPFMICYTSALTGYVLAKMRFKSRNAIFLTILVTMMFPWPITIIPLLQLVTKFGWTNNYMALIIPVAFNAFGIFLMRQFCISIPDELIDAARIDGANEFRIFHKIIIPLLWPPISALAIFTFLWTWEDFLWPFLVLSTNNILTLTLGLNRFVGIYYPTVGPMLAGSSIAIIPVLIFYFIFQNKFIEGATLSGLKE